MKFYLSYNLHLGRNIIYQIHYAAFQNPLLTIHSQMIWIDKLGSLILDKLMTLNIWLNNLIFVLLIHEMLQICKNL